MVAMDAVSIFRLFAPIVGEKPTNFRYLAIVTVSAEIVA